MLSADKFLDILQQKDLLPGDVLAAVRRRVAGLGKPVSAAAVAEQLVQMGHLTPALAERLLASAPAGPAASPAPPPDEDELGLAPLEEDKVRPASATKAPVSKEKPPDAPPPASPKTGKPKPVESELIALGPDEGEDADGLTILGDAEPKARHAGPAPSKKAPAPKTPAKTPQKQGTAAPGARKPAAEEPPEKPSQPAAKPQAEQKPRPAEKPPGEQKPQPPQAAPASLLDEELGSLGASSPASPLDTLMATSVLDAATASPLAPVAPRKKGLFGGLFAAKPRPGRRKNVWDSPLMLVGGGALLLMLIIGGVLFIVVSRESGDKLLDPANDDYSNGSYTQAIVKYNAFLEKYPGHPRASLARVRRGLSQMRQATEAGANWPKALETAKQVLEEIAPEDEFAEARDELASILPAIGQGLAADARKAPSAALVEQANETLGLVDKYVLKSLQNKVVLDDIRASLAITSHDLARESELDKAVAAMQTAVQAGKSAEAYQIRYALLKQYPDLATSAKLAGATAAVSKAQQSAVRVVQEPKAAEAGDPPSAPLASVAFAQQSGRDAPGAQGHVVYASYKGVVYAVDAASGKLLWRRGTGPGANGRSPAFAPTPVAALPESDVLLADAGRRELVRVEASTGRTRWRQAVGQPIEAHPVVAKDRVLVATAAGQGGRLCLIDLETGATSGHVELPQPIRVTPAVDARRDSVYLVAEHSNLYVLSLADGRCKQVVHLGHAPGGITAAPLCVANLLIVAENDKLDSCRLTVLAVEGDGQEAAFRPVQQDELAGHLDTPPLLSDRRLAVVTDRGAIRVYEISGASAKQPLAKVAERGAEGRDALVRFPLLAGGQLWVAGDGLARFDVQTAMGRLTPKAVSDGDSGDVFVQAPVVVGETLCHARYKNGLPGLLVSAVEMEGGKRIWQSLVGSPPAGEPKAGPPPGLAVVTAAGAAFRLDAAAVQGQTVAPPPAAAVEDAQRGETPRPLECLVYLPDGAAVLSAGAGADRLFVLDPTADAGKFVALPLPGPLSCAPVAFDGGLLAPCASGAVLLLDPKTGSERLGPFQPPLEPGAVLRWRAPAVLGEKDKKEFVIADGDRRLYRVGVKEQPKPHLEALATADLPAAIVSPVAVLGAAAYAVDSAGQLAAFALPELGRKEVARIEGRCVWGPARVGSRVLLATDEGRVLAIDGDGKAALDRVFEHGPLAGAPLEWEGGYLLASARGQIWHVGPSGGGQWQQSAPVETGLFLAAGPVMVEKRLFVCGHDGTLYEAPVPDKSKPLSPPAEPKPAEPKPEGPKPPEPEPDAPKPDAAKPPESKPDAPKPAEPPPSQP